MSPCNVPASDQHEKAVVTSENATMELKKSDNNEGEIPKIGRRKSFWNWNGKAWNLLGFQQQEGLMFTNFRFFMGLNV